MKGEKGTSFVHTLNGTAFATGRAIIAILENHQQADGDHPHPVRDAGQQFESHAGSLHLRHQVEPADDQNHHRRDVAQPPTGEPTLGEVRNRIGTEAAQRSGDEEQQGDVAGGIAEREPHGLRPVLHHQPGDAEEGRRR